MTVPMERDFDPGDDFPSVVMDALQRMLTAQSAAVPCSVRIKPGAANTLQVPAGSGQDAVGLVIDGAWRWNEAAAEQAGSGSAGLRDVWACAAASDYEAGSPGETDATDRSFVLRVTAADASAPGGFAHTRKIARGLWDGTQWIAIAPMVGGVFGSLDKTSGASIVAAEEARTNSSYGVLTTPDRVSSIVLPTGGLLAIWYQALWKQSVDGAARAAIFIGANQLKIGENDSAPRTQAAGSFQADVYRNLHTAPFGLIDQQSLASVDASDVTTGQVVGSSPLIDLPWTVEIGGTLRLGGAGNGALAANVPFGGPCYVFAAAGTYDVSVQFKASSGSVTAKNRKLWVQALGL